MSEPTTAVELHGLRKSFSGRGGEVVAVDGVDLSIGSGEVVALLGPNGAGKTTTLDMVLGMTDPSAGTARVFGRSPRQAVTDGRVSAVLQTGGLLADLTVHETLRYLASTFPGLPAERVGDVVERAGLTELTRRRVSKCSGGEQQRLRFAIALLAEPALLVLDEPTAGMDVAARRDFWAVMRAEAAQGRTVVFATHYLEEADDFADRIVLMARGRVVMDATTEQVRERATGRVVAADVPDVGVAAHRLGALGEVDVHRVAGLGALRRLRRGRPRPAGRARRSRPGGRHRLARGRLRRPDQRHPGLRDRRLRTPRPPRSRPRGPPMNATMLQLEIKRIVRDPVVLFFTVGLPVFFYLIFGAAQSYGDQAVAHGNVSMTVMAAMAAYGAVSATVGIGARAALERSQGWGRQLGLTPLSDRSYVTLKTSVAVAVAAIPIALVFLAGAVTGASGTVLAWVASGLVLVLGAAIFSLYGLCFGLAVRSEAALSAAGGSVVVLGFLGNLFFPLSGAILAIAKWSPLYGYAALARYPITDGALVSSSGAPSQESLWQPIVNVVLWLAILSVLATLLVRRGRGRQ